MVEFPLQTATERSLYIEALFVCLSRGAITVEKACSDLVELALQARPADLALSLRQKLLQRIEGIMAAYQGGAITEAVASQNFESLLVDEEPQVR